MESTIYGGVLATVGLVTLVRNVSLLRDERKLAHYVQTSPKAALWREKLGIERTIAISKRVFLPLGSVISLVLIVLGVKALPGL